MELEQIQRLITKEKRMPENFTIDIPNPCSQSWDAMNPSENGRYCRHCSSEVVDFTAMDLAQLQTYFQSAHRLCGRITTFQLAQLNQQKPQVKDYKRIGVRTAFAFTFTLLLTTRGAAQQFAKATNVAATVKVRKSPVLSSNHGEVEMILKGTVRDGDTVLQGTTFKVNGLALTTKTDAAGRFNLPIKGRKNDHVRLSLSHLGYQTQQLELILTSQSQQVTVNLVPDELALGELVFVGQKYPERQTTIVGGISVTLRKRPSLFRRVINAIGNYFSNNHHQ